MTFFSKLAEIAGLLLVGIFAAAVLFYAAQIFGVTIAREPDQRSYPALGVLGLVAAAMGFLVYHAGAGVWAVIGDIVYPSKDS